MLAGLVSQFLLSGMVTRSSAWAQTRKKEWGCYVVAIISGIVAISFLTASLYMGLSLVFSEVLAALATGLILLTVSCIFVALANYEDIRKERQKRVQASIDSIALDRQINEILSEIKSPIQENPATALILSGLAGFLASEKLH